MELSPITIGMLAIAALLVIFRLSISKQSPRSARAGRSQRRFGGVGTGAAGAFHDMLNQDQRKAIEIIVEEKAAARDPETQDDTVDPGETEPPARRP